ncbi:MAG: ABC transporter substrate-binding protein [Acidiferrobacterales bacterium]|nr:ABC transporter substrate-binding protein [Acidiferrobacterales bacterium]
MQSIHIQFTLFSAFYTPLILAMSKGFLKEEGLDYEWSVSPPGTSAVDAIVNGTAQVIQSAPSQGFNALLAGKTPPALHFAQINEMDGFFITSRDPQPDFDWKDLEGKEVVMFKAGQPNAMFRYACFKAGINYDALLPVTPGGAAAIDDAFRDGQGDYVVQQGPFPQQLAQEQLGHVVAQVGPMIGPNAFSSLAASPQWLQTEEAAAFTRAYRATRRYIQTASATDITRSIVSYFPETNIDALESCIATYQSLGCWTPHIEITPEAFEVTLDVFEYVNHIAERYRYDQVCVTPPA